MMMMTKEKYPLGAIILKHFTQLCNFWLATAGRYVVKALINIHVPNFDVAG